MLNEVKNQNHMKKRPYHYNKRGHTIQTFPQKKKSDILHIIDKGGKKTNIQQAKTFFCEYIKRTLVQIVYK